jgi:hypothetical protein
MGFANLDESLFRIGSYRANAARSATGLLSMKIALSSMGTDFRIRRDNDKPMLRKALNNARQLLYDLKDDL